MEISSVLRYCSSHELEMEDPNNAYADIQSQMSFLDHHRLEYLNNTQHITAALASSGGQSTYPAVLKRSFSHSSMESAPHHHDQAGGDGVEECRPSKHITTNSWNSSSSGHDISNITTRSGSPNNNNILSFGISASSDSLANYCHHNKQQQQQYESMMCEVKANYVNHQSYASNKGRPGGGIANNKFDKGHFDWSPIILLVPLVLGPEKVNPRLWPLRSLYIPIHSDSVRCYDESIVSNHKDLGG